MAPLLLPRPAFATASTSRNAPSSRARSIVVRALKQDAVQPAPAFLATAVTASMLLGAQMVVPEDAFAAQTAGRASASKFRSARRAAISESAPQVNNYSSTTIVAAPPVYSPPVVVAPPPPFGISIVPVIPIPLPNPFASPAPAPVAATVAADAAAATASAEAAAAAATAAAAAATAAAAVAAAK